MDREQLRKNLLVMQTELTERVDKIKSDYASGHLSKALDEQALERENDEVLAGIEDEAVVELEAIDKALARIETDAFGQCEQCGEAIADARLQAVPYATTCVSCVG